MKHDLSEKPFVNFDRIHEIRPLDHFGVGVSNGLAGGILYAFAGQLAAAGVEMDFLSEQLERFAALHYLDLHQSDPRFWDAMMSGLKQVKEHGPVDGTPPEAAPRTEEKQSVLTRIAMTLPPYKAGRDRQARFEADGTIVYDREDGEDGAWTEPPRDIDGYERDPDNEWCFRPLWPECYLRQGQGVRYQGCGCLGVIMRCANPSAPKFAERVTHTDCLGCPHRKETE